jgi:hypothetical protein
VHFLSFLHVAVSQQPEGLGLKKHYRKNCEKATDDQNPSGTASR